MGVYSLPQGSGATLKDPTTLTPTFAPDFVGLYVVRLILDGGAASDDVTVDVQANLLTLHFHGTFGPDGVADGSFTYEITQGPTATNIRSLKPNVLYRLTSWNMVLTSGPQTASLLPSNVFDSSQPDNTAEFCEGICIFSSTPLAELRFHNATPFMLQLMFEHADAHAVHQATGQPRGMGGVSQSLYRVPNDVLAIFTSGTLHGGAMNAVHRKGVGDMSGASFNRRNIRMTLTLDRQFVSTGREAVAKANGDMSQASLVLGFAMGYLKEDDSEIKGDWESLSS